MGFVESNVIVIWLGLAGVVVLEALIWHCALQIVNRRSTSLAPDSYDGPPDPAPRISVVIAAKNEEAHIAACLESVQWADEIVVVDDGRGDRTVAIAEELGARVLHNDSGGVFHVNKNLGLQSAVGEWILSLDADAVAAVGY